jgi:hypothetical protein
MLTVLLPECALGVQLPALGHFGNLLTLLLVANPVFDGLNWPLSPPGVVWRRRGVTVVGR